MTEKNKILFEVERIIYNITKTGLPVLAENSELTNGGYFYQSILRLLTLKGKVHIDFNEILNTIEIAFKENKNVITNGHNHLTIILIESFKLANFFVENAHVEDQNNKEHKLTTQVFLEVYLKIIFIISKAMFTQNQINQQK